FNAVGALIDHQLRGLHHVNVDSPNWHAWDIGSLVHGAALLAAGCAIIRAARDVAAPPGHVRPGLACVAVVRRAPYREASPAPCPMPDSLSEDALAALTLLALVTAHGADSDLDPREVDTLADRLHVLAPDRSGDEVIHIVKRGVRA